MRTVDIEVVAKDMDNEINAEERFMVR